MPSAWACTAAKMAWASEFPFIAAVTLAILAFVRMRRGCGGSATARQPTATRLVAAATIPADTRIFQDSTSSVH